jgi:hypothetical protein
MRLDGDAALLSRSMASSNCSDMSRVAIVPVMCNNRSESVVFPWSMWAMMLKLRMCAASICKRLNLNPTLLLNQEIQSPTRARQDRGNVREEKEISILRDLRFGVRTGLPVNSSP